MFDAEKRKLYKKKSSLASSFRRCCALLVCLILCASLDLFFAVDRSEAETVTDTLTIKIGYWGMEEKDYIKKGSYHWTELQRELNQYEIPYSYFRDRDNGTYKTIVAPGKGFTLEELFYYAGVNLSDIKNISFYTNDYSTGAFVSFTPYQLLEEPRYYYDNLAAHINNEYNDLGMLTGYTVDPSVNEARQQVPTMLALESSWSEYEPGTPNTSPSFSGLSTSSRFRLLFGQTEPTEMRTNQSAKYVHTIALTVPGSPEIKPGSGASTGNIKLSKEIGKHSITFFVATDTAMIEDIKKDLEWESSDDRILRIDNIQMDRAAEFDDAVAVTIDYEVLRSGDATINGKFKEGSRFSGIQLSGSSVATDRNEPNNNAPAKKDKDKNKDSDNRKARDDNGNSSAGENRIDGKSPTNIADTDKDRRLSLTDRGGRVTARTPQSAASAAQSSKLVAMDLESIFETEDPEKPAIKKDESREYAPFIGGGVGTMILLGGAASALQFRSELGELTLRLRRRSI